MEEVEDFFRGYDYIKGSILFGQEADGRRSGECWITFTTETEAIRAVAEKDHKYMGTRYIQLNRV